VNQRSGKNVLFPCGRHQTRRYSWLIRLITVGEAGKARFSGISHSLMAFPRSSEPCHSAQHSVENTKREGVRRSMNWPSGGNPLLFPLLIPRTSYFHFFPKRSGSFHFSHENLCSFISWFYQTKSWVALFRALREIFHGGGIYRLFAQDLWDRALYLSRMELPVQNQVALGVKAP
jgi:hypothetical protein